MKIYNKTIYTFNRRGSAWRIR